MPQVLPFAVCELNLITLIGNRLGSLILNLIAQAETRIKQFYQQMLILISTNIIKLVLFYDTGTINTVRSFGDQTADMNMIVCLHMKCFRSNRTRLQPNVNPNKMPN